MNFMNSLFDNDHQNHRRKVNTVTKQSIMNSNDLERSELMRMRRERCAERRRRQINAFFDNMSAQNADKVIMLFDGDLNIA